MNLPPLHQNFLDSALPRLQADPPHSGRRGLSHYGHYGEVNILFVAGHETTATTLAWCFYLLARNPEDRARVQADADAFGSEDPARPEPQRLEYPTRVFKEALRLYPPVILLARRALEPVTLAGCELPAHTLVMVSPYTIHFHPRPGPTSTASTSTASCRRRRRRGPSPSGCRLAWDRACASATTSRSLKGQSYLQP
jgi:hypothetical protein